MSTPAGQRDVASPIVCYAVLVVVAVAIIAGSINMLRLKGYGGAMTAAVLATIPICSPCFVLGIPFGIWAFVVLRKPEVRSRFSA